MKRVKLACVTLGREGERVSMVLTEWSKKRERRRGKVTENLCKESVRLRTIKVSY